MFRVLNFIVLKKRIDQIEKRTIETVELHDIHLQKQMGYYAELLCLSKNVELYMSVPNHNDKNVEKSVMIWWCKLWPFVLALWYTHKYKGQSLLCNIRTHISPLGQPIHPLPLPTRMTVITNTKYCARITLFLKSKLQTLTFETKSSYNLSCVKETSKVRELIKQH